PPPPALSARKHSLSSLMCQSSLRVPPSRPTSVSSHLTFFPPISYSLSLHDALPICTFETTWSQPGSLETGTRMPLRSSWGATTRDRKSTRLNSSHQIISYAVFCLKKKNII